MRVIITCGPSYEPLDQVRRLTNFSTGELGVTLAERLGTEGAEVVCLKGEAASFRDPAPPVITDPFTTNEHLEQRLQHWASLGTFNAVLHVAALCDFKIHRVMDASGNPRNDGKIPSNTEFLQVTLAPARKLLPELPRLFPMAKVVGWKYEVDRDMETAIQRGLEQMTANSTHACVVNGPACGSKLILCLTSGQQIVCDNRPELIDQLTRWLKSA